MTNHELTFSKIKKLLKSHFTERFSEFDKGTHLVLNSKNEKEESIWIDFNKNGQLIVGFGISHLHYFTKYDDLNKGFNQFLCFLTCKKRRIDFYKGRFHFKSKYEFENENGEFETFGFTSSLALPFWKKTTERTITQNEFIDYAEIKSEIEEIKNTMHNTV